MSRLQIELLTYFGALIRNTVTSVQSQTQQGDVISKQAISNNL